MSFNVSPYTSSNAMWPSSFGGGVSKYESYYHITFLNSDVITLGGADTFKTEILDKITIGIEMSSVTLLYNNFVDDDNLGCTWHGSIGDGTWVGSLVGHSNTIPDLTSVNEGYFDLLYAGDTPEELETLAINIYDIFGADTEIYVGNSIHLVEEDREDFLDHGTDNWFRINEPLIADGFSTMSFQTIQYGRGFTLNPYKTYGGKVLTTEQLAEAELTSKVTFHFDILAPLILNFYGSALDGNILFTNNRNGLWSYHYGATNTWQTGIGTVINGDTIQVVWSVQVGGTGDNLGWMTISNLVNLEISKPKEINLVEDGFGMKSALVDGFTQETLPTDGFTRA